MSGKPYRLVLLPSGKQGSFIGDVTLLDAAHQLGVTLEAVCGGAKRCGKCLVAPLSGHFPKYNLDSSSTHLSSPDAAEIAHAHESGIDLTMLRMACAARLTGDLVVDVPASSLHHEPIIRKAIGDQLVASPNPAVKLHRVQVAVPSLGGRSDSGRLSAALSKHNVIPSYPLAVLRQLSSSLRDLSGDVTAAVYQSSMVLHVEPGEIERVYGLAIDIGSTTLAMYLVDLTSGTLVSTESSLNPQIRYGEDLISRLSFATLEPGGTERLQQSVLHRLNDMIQKISRGINAAHLLEVVIVGNPVMHHLLLGINPTHLGHTPFTLTADEGLVFDAATIGLHGLSPCAKAYLLPSIAGFVGADCAAVLLSVRQSLLSHTALVIDIGTNAEILLSHHGQIWAASAPTGPTFEGAHIQHGQRAAAGAIERVTWRDGGLHYKVIGDERWSSALGNDESLQATGICGSGIIEAISALLESGQLEPSGRLVDQREVCLVPAHQSASGSDIVIMQKDVRAIQLAKAAVLSSIHLLMQRADVVQIDHIYLAGGFGSYIDPLHAIRIGLLPPCPAVHAIGNAAGDGACMALLDVDARRAIDVAVRGVHFVETAADAAYQDDFINAISFPTHED